MTLHESSRTRLHRRDVVARILRDRGVALAVSSLGNPTFDLAAAGDCPQNFYLWGAMGGAVMLGVGLAQAQPKRRVLVFVGDGEMMMGLGSLATAAVQRVKNLGVIVLDNEHYAETGMQPAHAGRGVDITGIAAAAGFPQAHLVHTESELETASSLLLNGEGPILVTVKVSVEPASTVLPPRDGPHLRSRFREALLGTTAHR
jgi:thiamine pyrophosphate-dependent acetolactate synthase large subunit-like protein